MEKQPLNLDWDQLLPGRRHTPPQPVEAEATAAAASELSDRDLQENIKRMSKILTRGLPDRLPDEGHKLRSAYQLYCDEIDRRNLAGVQKGVPECTRDKIAKSPDRFGENGSKSTSVGSNSHGKSDDKTDAAFSEELRLISRDKCKTLRENGLQNLEERQPLEKSPQAVVASSSVCYPKKDKQRFSNCKFSDIGCPKTTPSSQAGKNLSRRLSKRRRVSTYRGAKTWEFEEVQHVVLLDDEEAQPICSTQGGDTSENWKEYKIYYPSRGDPECVELSYSDLKCLYPESYLSSPIMNFYIQYLQRSSSPMAKRNGDCYIFNTFFYSKLEEAMTGKYALELGDYLYSSEGRRVRDDYTSFGFSGASLKQSHFFYSCLLKEEWFYINQNAASQDFPISERIWKNLPRRIEKKKITVPQQKNEYDCGLFVLYFVERFIEEAPERLRKKDFSMFGRKWFQPEDASGLRNKVREVLINEFESNMLMESGASENDEQL